MQFTVKTAKNFSFADRQGQARIFAGVDKARHRALTRGGSMIRKVARRRIRRARRKFLHEIEPDKRWRYDPRENNSPLPRPWAPSEPGQSPRSRTDLLRNFLFFAFDSDTNSVVIGPALLSQLSVGSTPVPSILEYGGSSDGSNIEERPLVRPAEEAVRAQYVRLWQGAML